MFSLEKSIGIGSDHAGYELKMKVIKYLETKGIDVKDYGTFSEESVDYPDYAHLIARAMKQGDHDRGILICGTGVGISISANRHNHIRCALCWDTEIAKLARNHNDANVLALAGRFTSEENAKKIIDAFLETKFEGGRHKIRVDKMNCT